MAEEKYKFILFVSGMSVKSVRAVENLKLICDAHLQDRFDLEIIDITKNADLAVKYQIFAIPTLIKVSPAPLRTLVGDLSDTPKVLRILDIA